MYAISRKGEYSLVAPQSRHMAPPHLKSLLSELCLCRIEFVVGFGFAVRIGIVYNKNQ